MILKIGFSSNCHCMCKEMPFWGIFLRALNGKCWYILWPLVTFYGNWVYFVACRYLEIIWYIFPVLVFCTKKRLSTLCDTLAKLRRPIKSKIEITKFSKRMARK
jgi:hypothetical protein